MPIVFIFMMFELIFKNECVAFHVLSFFLVLLFVSGLFCVCWLHRSELFHAGAHVACWKHRGGGRITVHHASGGRLLVVATVDRGRPPKTQEVICQVYLVEFCQRTLLRSSDCMEMELLSP